MIKKLTLCIGLAVLGFPALAQSNGAAKGVPFQDVQQVLQAASDALAAAVSANTANIAANTAAIDAEASARLAQDALLKAQFAAELALEAVARISGDEALADAIAAEELARIEGIDLLGTRIDALEQGAGTTPVNYTEVSYVETNNFDFTSLSTDVFELDYLAGEWFYMASTYAPTGETSAVCTSHANAYNAIFAVAVGGSGSFSLNGSMTYVMQEGSNTWATGSASMVVMPGLFRVSGTNLYTQLFDRTVFGSSPGSELTTASGTALDSTAVLRAAPDREAACGF